ncbi:MAG: hypothetical protein WD749_12785 [Phycisphaerales bacterium]
MNPAPRPAALALLAAVCLAGACQERIVRYKPFFAGLEGVQTQTPAVYEKSPALPNAAADADETPLYAHGPDGKTRLISRTGIQLMHHIRTVLAEGDAELFGEQVLSGGTQREFRERGLDPGEESLRRLKPREKDIAKLFARMPMGEHSPNVLTEPLGGNTFRVKLTGPATRELHWTGFDMVLEQGNYRLRWFF